MVDGEEIKKDKDRLFRMFVLCVKDLSKGKLLKLSHLSFEEIVYYLGEVLKYFPKKKQSDIEKMIEVANDELPYVQALKYVEFTKPGHEKREQKIYGFLQKYSK